jgi:hypothetical protein
MARVMMLRGPYVFYRQQRSKRKKNINAGEHREGQHREGTGEKED